MYKVVIVDDEDGIREGLRRRIDWSGMGFAVAGEAADGNRAYEVIADVRPHVVLTDIRMPFCTGIQLMERLKRERPEVRIVVLSGYDEFEYARSAIEAGAAGYLLKPIKKDKLRDIFANLKRELDSLISGDIQRNQAAALLRDQFLGKLVLGRFRSPSSLAAKAEEAGISLVYDAYAVLLLQCHRHDAALERYGSDGPELLHYALRNVAEELFGQDGFACGFETDRRAPGMLLAAKRLEAERLAVRAQQVIDAAQSLLQLTVSAAVGDIVGRAEEIAASYQSALLRVESIFFAGPGTVAAGRSAGQAAGVPCLPLPPPPPFEKVCSVLQQLDREAMEAFVDSCFAGLTDRESVYDRAAQLIKLAGRAAEPSSPRAPGLPGSTEAEAGAFRGMETLEEVAAAVKRAYAGAMERLEQAGRGGRSRWIDEVRKYIEQSYAKDISLEAAAERIHMHPLYVSRMFKKEIGVNFIDYLTEVRVGKAKEMLGQFQFKVYEISELVGYGDPKHFSKVFKKSVGVTPKEYRKLVLGAEENGRP